MRNLPDSATLPQTAPAVNSEAIEIAPGVRCRDGTRRGLLRRSGEVVGNWTIYAGGPVEFEIRTMRTSKQPEILNYWSVRVDTVRALLVRHGYAVAGAAS